MKRFSKLKKRSSAGNFELIDQKRVELQKWL